MALGGGAEREGAEGRRHAPRSGLGSEAGVAAGLRQRLGDGEHHRPPLAVPSQQGPRRPGRRGRGGGEWPTARCGEGQTARRERARGGASRGGAGGARGRVRLPQNDPKRGEKEGKRWGPLQSNPNKHPLEGIVFWSGLDASNPI